MSLYIRLNLGGNEIRIVPQNFGNLSNLYYLKINPIVLFLPQCKKLTNLQHLKTQYRSQSYIMKLAKNGTILWINTYPSEWYYEFAGGLTTDSQNNIFFMILG